MDDAPMMSSPPLPSPPRREEPQQQEPDDDPGASARRADAAATAAAVLPLQDGSGSSLGFPSASASTADVLPSADNNNTKKRKRNDHYDYDYNYDGFEQRRRHHDDDEELVQLDDGNDDNVVIEEDEQYGEGGDDDYDDYYYYEDDAPWEPPSPAPSPPDPRRYLALWDDERRRRHQQPQTQSPNNGGMNNNCCRQWEQELELAEYTTYIRDQIRECHRRADEHRQVIKEHKRLLEECLDEAHKLETQVLHELMVFPLLNDNQFWDRTLSPEIKHSKELAWMLLRRSTGGVRLPDAFQRMLWTDPTCPLRHDRNVMLASLRQGLCRSYGISRIVWAPELANDREIVLKCFETCPEYLSLDPDAGGDLLAPYLQDVDALRAFAFAPNPTQYRTFGYCRRESGIHAHFAPGLFKDPTFMADLVVHLFRRKEDDDWARQRLKDAFPQLEWGQGMAGTFRYVLPEKVHTLLENADFAIRLAEGLATLPPKDRQKCPVTYAVLSVPVRRNPNVALAFAKFDAAQVVGCVPVKLKRDTNVWNELWTMATQQDPFAMYHKALKSTPCPILLESKELAIRLLKASRAADDSKTRLEAFAAFFPNLSTSIQHDRDVQWQLVLSWAKVPMTELQSLIDPANIESLDFWIDLAKNVRCRRSALDLVPENIANDERLVLVWAQQACPNKAIEWLAEAVSNYPHLDLLSDHHVLLNWLPTLCSNVPAAVELRKQVPPESIASPSLWVELLQMLQQPRNLLQYVPENLQSDLDVVDAQLRCASKNYLVLAACYSALSPELRDTFVSYIVRAIRNSRESYVIKKWRQVSISLKLYRVPEVVLALFGKGWAAEDVNNQEFENLAWRNDPEFLLKVADVTATHRRRGLFWACCSDALRTDKAFLLRVLRRGKNVVPELYLNESLAFDFDVRCAQFVRFTDRQIRQCLSDDVELGEGDWFPLEVRTQWQTFVSLQVFLSGVVVPPSTRSGDSGSRSSAATASAVSLLGQDEDTMIDFKRRLAEYLGCPSSVDEVQELRIVSNRLTLVGY